MFLDNLFKKKPEKSNVTKQAIQHDDWDRHDWSKLMDEMKEFSVADDQLSDFTPTGHEAMTDTFYSLYKSVPMLEDKKLIRPSYLVNHRIIQEAMDLKEWNELRAYSSLDLVASGMACVAMEPELEVLFDKLKEEQAAAQEIEQMLQQMAGMESEQQSVEEMIAQALEEGNEQQAQDYQEQQGKLSEALERLRAELDGKTQELEESLDAKSSTISSALGKAMDQARDEAESMDSLSSSWGLEKGTIKRMLAPERIELAKRINTPKFKKLADLIGPMQRLAMAEQARKLDFAKSEVYDLELGDDLQHVLPEELLFLGEDEYEMIFFQKFYDAQLVQFKLRGSEKVARGDIIFCEDGSSSMSMDNREIWAKAVALSLLQIARHQKRNFTGIQFSSPNVWKKFEFDFTKRRVYTVDYSGNTDEFDELEGVLVYAETFMNGGTCFMTPLNQAVNMLSREFEASKKIKGDIVFCTDGQAGVPKEFLDLLNQEKERLGFKIYGIAVGAEPETEPLNTISDGRVFRVKDLINGKDISQVFRDV